MTLLFLNRYFQSYLHVNRNLSCIILINDGIRWSFDNFDRFEVFGDMFEARLPGLKDSYMSPFMHKGDESDQPYSHDEGYYTELTCTEDICESLWS